MTTAFLAHGFPQHWHHVTFNTLRPRQNGRLFADDIFKCIFFNEIIWISITISLKFVSKGPINNIPALVQISSWNPSSWRTGNHLSYNVKLPWLHITRASAAMVPTLLPLNILASEPEELILWCSNRNIPGELFNTMAADALAPWVTRSSVPMPLNMLMHHDISMTSTWKIFNYLCHLNFEKLWKIQIYFNVSGNSFSLTGVKCYICICAEQMTSVPIFYLS